MKALSVVACRELWRCLLLMVLALTVSSQVLAQSQSLSRTLFLDIPSEDLPHALIEFSKQTGIQVITTGSPVDSYKTRRVSGQMTASEALRRLLEGTPLRFRLLGPNTIGIDREKPVTTSGARSDAVIVAVTEPRSNSDEKSSDIGEIVVTARKHKESIIDVPESISVLSADALNRMGVQSFTDYATKVPDLSFSYGTGGLGFANSRTMAIRGISGGGTTAMYVDDTPVDEAMDPRVLDTERIEVLKGPQGTLFGEGSLGGAIRIVPQKPSLANSTLSYSATGGGTLHGGSPNYGATVIFNFVPVSETLAVRVLGFASHDAGFVTRTYPGRDGTLGSNDNQGAQLSYGGSLSALLQLGDRWEVLGRVLGQQQQDHGLPVAYAPLPGFEPRSLIMNRAANIQEFANEHWVMPTLEVNYRGDQWALVSASSFLDRRVSETEDGTEGTIQASQAFFGYTPQTVIEAWPQTIRSRHFTEELRATLSPVDWINGTIGGYFSNKTDTSAIGPYEMPGLTSSSLFPSDLGWVSDINNNTKEIAIFGEAYLKPIEATTLTIGLRKYWLRQRFEYSADGLFNGGATRADTPNTQNGVSPKVALEYKLDRDMTVYTSAAKGFRAGGGTTPLPPFCAGNLQALGLTPASAAKYTSDSVWSYEVGAKAQVLDRRVLVTGAAYQINWTNIQQPVFLPICGFTFTTNAGAARSRGGEFELAGQVASGLDVRLGIGYDDAKITEQGRSNQIPGTEVHEVPKITATAAGTYTRALSSTVDGFVSGDLSYVGSSVSAVSSLTSPLVRPSYRILNLRIGVNHDHDEFSIFADNITDERANLGDINPLSYARYKNGIILPRVAVLRPLTLGLRYQHGY
jgi:iron complex outermembrane receptor protein